MFYLILSAFSESIWNVFLAKSKGLLDWRNNIPGLIFVSLAVLLFKKALESISLGVSVTIWSGFSILLSVAWDIIFFKTKIDSITVLFIILCIISVIGLNYYSNQAK